MKKKIRKENELMVVKETNLMKLENEKNTPTKINNFQSVDIMSCSPSSSPSAFSLPSSSSSSSYSTFSSSSLPSSLPCSLPFSSLPSSSLPSSLPSSSLPSFSTFALIGNLNPSIKQKKSSAISQKKLSENPKKISVKKTVIPKKRKTKKEKSMQATFLRFSSYSNKLKILKTKKKILQKNISDNQIPSTLICENEKDKIEIIKKSTIKTDVIKVNTDDDKINNNVIINHNNEVNKKLESMNINEKKNEIEKIVKNIIITPILQNIVDLTKNILSTKIDKKNYLLANINDKKEEKNIKKIKKKTEKNKNSDNTKIISKKKISLGTTLSEKKIKSKKESSISATKTKNSLFVFNKLNHPESVNSYVICDIEKKIKNVELPIMIDNCNLSNNIVNIDIQHIKDTNKFENENEKKNTDTNKCEHDDQKKNTNEIKTNDNNGNIGNYGNNSNELKDDININNDNDKNDNNNNNNNNNNSNNNNDNDNTNRIILNSPIIHKKYYEDKIKKIKKLGIRKEKLKNRQEKIEVKKVKKDNMMGEKKLSGPIVINGNKLDETVKDDNILNLSVSTYDKITNVRDSNSNNNKNYDNDNNNDNNNIKSFTTIIRTSPTLITQSSTPKTTLIRTPTTSNTVSTGVSTSVSTPSSTRVSTSLSTDVRASEITFKTSDEENENNPRKGLFFSDSPVFNQSDFSFH